MADFDPLTIPAVMPGTVRRTEEKEVDGKLVSGFPTEHALSFEQASQAWMKANAANTNTRLSLVSDEIGDVSASVQVLADAQADLEGAFASYQVTVTAQFGAVNAAITTESTARANADSAISSTVTSLTATVNGNTAAISAETTARANADTAISATVTSLTATVSGNTAAISSEATTRATADSALSSSISTVDAKANNATASGAIYFAAKAWPTGATAAYGVHLTAGASFAGFEMLALSGGGAAIGLTANQFYFTDSGTAEQVLIYDSGLGAFIFNVPVIIRSGTSGERKEETNKNEKYYDAAGQLRVAIGIDI